jgi:hypothetical protein
LTLGANRGGNGIASKRQSTGAGSIVGVATWAFAAAGTQKKTIPHSNNDLYKFFMSSPFVKVLLCFSYSFITYTSRFLAGGFVIFCFFFRKVNRKVLNCDL